jgi:diguanylate cyclase (GGDEF)-like protein
LRLLSWERATSNVLHLVRLDSIRRRIVIFALLATLIPSLGLGWRSYVLNRQFLSQKLSENLRDATFDIVREVNLWLKERLYEVRIFSSSYEVTENLEHLVRASGPPARLAEARRRLADYLASVQDKFRDYEELMVVDTTGRVLVSSAAAPGPALPAEWLKGTRGEATVVGDAYWDEARQKGVMLVAVPIAAAHGRSLGLMAGKVNFDTLVEILRSHALGETGQAYLVTPDGSVIVGSRVPLSVFKQVRLPTAATRALFAGPETPVEYTPDRGRPVIGSLKPVPQLGWGVVADLTQAEAYGLTARMRNLTLITVAALLAVIGLTAYFFGQAVARPLQRLTRGASRVAGGDLEVTLPVMDRGEVGYLTQVFNHMVTRLRQARDELAAANAALSEKNQELQKLSITDSLTGLNNRRHLTEVLVTEVARARRLRERFALLMIDIDHFKQYNDHYGHLAGDRLLSRLAGIFRDAIRDIDYAARYGGEEFLLLLHGADGEAAAQVAERIRARVADEPFGDAAQPARVTVSVGIASFPAQGDGPEAIIASADAALYEAKGRGRNRVVVAGEAEGPAAG